MTPARARLPAQRPDRRVRKTRASLGAAMLELLSKREYSAITVEHVIQQADVARATFYAHYAEKDDLFLDVVSELTKALVERASDVAPIHAPAVGGAAVYELFRHAERHPHVYLAMIHGAAGGMAVHEFRSALQSAYLQLLRAQASAFGVEARLPLDFIVRAWVGEHLALIAWWLEDKPPYSAADLTRMRLLLMTEGPLWARGLLPGQVVFDEAQFERIVAADRSAG